MKALSITSQEFFPHRWFSALKAQFLGFLLPFSSETNSHFQAVPQHCQLWLFTAKLTISKLPLYNILAVSKCLCGPKIHYANCGAGLVNDTPQRGLRKVWEYLCLWWWPQERVGELKKKPVSIFCFKTQIRHTCNSHWQQKGEKETQLLLSKNTVQRAKTSTNELEMKIYYGWGKA